jgi:hypothetical protein
MKRIGAILLVAVIALGFAGAMKAEKTTCCDSDDRCARSSLSSRRLRDAGEVTRASFGYKRIGRSPG